MVKPLSSLSVTDWDSLEFLCHPESSIKDFSLLAVLALGTLAAEFCFCVIDGSSYPSGCLCEVISA